MMNETAEDYAKYFQNCNIEQEIHPLCISIEEMLARLDEFETLLSNVKSETNSILQSHIVPIINLQENFQLMQKRIDNLEQFVELVNNNVNEVEKSLDVAKEELDITDYSLKDFLLQPLFSKAKSGVDSLNQQTNSNLKNGEFQSVPVFRTSDYFNASEIKVEPVPELQPIDDVMPQCKSDIIS